MTGDMRFLREELDRLGEIRIAKDPEFAKSKLYLRTRDAMKREEPLPPFGDCSGIHTDPQNETEARWLKNYNRSKAAYFRRLRMEET